MRLFDFLGIPGAICTIGNSFMEIVKKVHDDYKSDKVKKDSSEKKEMNIRSNNKQK